MVPRRKSSDVRSSNLKEDTNMEKAEDSNEKHIKLRDINDCYVIKITEGSLHIKKVCTFAVFCNLIGFGIETLFLSERYSIIICSGRE